MGKKIKVGISIGDLNGIGLEIIIKTFKDNRMMEFCTPIIFGSSEVAAIHRKALNMQNFNFNAINITLGLPFIRISPDHGTNNQMLGKKKSDPTSLKEALFFLKKLNEN